MALVFVSIFGFAFLIRFNKTLLCQSTVKLSINREFNDDDEDDVENEGGIVLCDSFFSTVINFKTIFTFYQNFIWIEI